MARREVKGYDRLRVSGYGVVAGGVLLAALSLFFGYAVSCGVVVGGGVAVWVRNRGQEGGRVGTGAAVVGVIGLFEASGLGIGFRPVALGGAAVAFGLFDVAAGLALGRLSDR